MSTRLLGPRPPGARLRPLLGGWFLLVLFLQSACATNAPWGGMLAGYRYRSLAPPPAPQERVALTAEPGLGSAAEYVAAFLEPGAVATRPVPILKPEFQQAFERLARDVRLGRSTPREAAHELLKVLEEDWLVEPYRGRVLTLVPVNENSALTPVADEALKQHYLQWCVPRGGGDCLSLLDDGPFLKADDRRAFALAMAFGRVLDETREALKAELFSVQALVSMLVWTVALYGLMWVVPEPTTKLVAASLTI
ncbi:MAG: AHH domain-containing protein, partial [Archangium sp.]